MSAVSDPIIQGMGRPAIRLGPGRLALLGALALLTLGRAALGAPPGFVERAPGQGYRALVSAPNGLLYVVQTTGEGSGILRLDPRTGGGITFNVPTEDADVVGIAAGPDGRLWFTESGAGQVGRLDPGNGQVDEFPLTPTHGLSQAHPRPITAGTDGSLWFVQVGPQGTGTDPAAFVGRMTLGGVHTEFRVPTDGAFGPDEGIASDPDGRIWFTESAKGKVGRLDSLSSDPQATLQEFALPAGLGPPVSITSGPDGALWVGGTGAVARVTVDGTAVVVPLPPEAAGARVTGIATGADGRLWLALPAAGALGRVDPATRAVELFPVGPAATGRRPTAIAPGPDGNIWYTDPGVGRIGQASFLSILPAPGTLITTQLLDVTVVNHHADRFLVGGRMLLDGADVTAEFLGCVTDGAGAGRLAAGGQSFRCRAVPAGFLRAGPHVVEVEAQMSAGPSLKQAVAWEVLGSVEPGFGPGGFLGGFRGLLPVAAVRPGREHPEPRLRRRGQRWPGDRVPGAEGGRRGRERPGSGLPDNRLAAGWRRHPTVPGAAGGAPGPGIPHPGTRGRGRDQRPGSDPDRPGDRGDHRAVHQRALMPSPRRGRGGPTSWGGGLAVLVAFLALAACAVSDGPQPSERGDVRPGGPRRPEPVAVGEAVPDFTAPGLDGQVVRWRERAPGPTVLVVWASWCPHCRRLLPLLGQVSREFPSVGIVTVTTSIGRYSGPSPDEVMGRSGLPGPTARDAEDNPLARALGVHRYPTLFWVGRDGRVREVIVGAADETTLRQAFRLLASCTPVGGDADVPPDAPRERRRSRRGSGPTARGARLAGACGWLATCARTGGQRLRHRTDGGRAAGPPGRVVA